MTKVERATRGRIVEVFDEEAPGEALPAIVVRQREGLRLDVETFPSGMFGTGYRSDVRHESEPASAPDPERPFRRRFRWRWPERRAPEFVEVES